MAIKFINLNYILPTRPFADKIYSATPALKMFLMQCVAFNIKNIQGNLAQPRIAFIFDLFYL